MKVINTLTIKHLKMNKKRTLVTIIGIILTSCLLFTMGLGISTMRQNSIEETIRREGTQHVTFSDLPYSNTEILKNDNNIDTVIAEEFLNTYGYEEFGETWKLDIVSMDASYDEYITLSNGAMPSNENEIIISFSLARNKGFEIGGYIKDKKIVGVYRSSKLHHYEYVEGMNMVQDYAYCYNKVNKDSNVNFYVTYKSLNNIFNNIYKTADSLGLDYEELKNNRLYNNTLVNYNLLSAYGKFESYRTQTVLYLTLVFILTILSFVCIFVIYNSFAISLSERKKYMGILRSIGTTKKQLFKSVFFEASILSLISIPIGFVLSFGLIEIVLSVMNKMLEYSLTIPLKFAIYPSFMIVSLVFILSTIFLSARFSAYKASETTPIELIRMNDDINVSGVKENKLIKKVFGAEGDLAYKNIKRNKSKYTITIISLCISIILFITFSTYINYFLSNSDDSFARDFDISITVPDVNSQKKIVDEISKIKYIDEFVQYKRLTVYYKSLDGKMFTDEYYNRLSNKLFDYISVFGIDDKNYNKYKNKVKLTDNSKMILYNHAEAFIPDDNMTTGEYVDFDVFKESNINLKLCTVEFKNMTTDGKVIYEEKECYLDLNNFHFTNIDLFEGFGWGPSIIVDMNKFDEVSSVYSKYNNEGYSEYDDTQLGINSKKYKQFDEEMEKIINKYPNVDIYYMNNKLNNYAEYMSIMATKLLLYSIVAFITIIAVTSVFNTINTSINLREREFSMLRSVGLSKTGLNKMIKLESVFLVIKTLMYGIPLSLLMIFIIFILDYAANKKMNMIFPTKYFTICFVGITLIIFLTMWYSTRKIKNKNIIDSIKNENI